MSLVDNDNAKGCNKFFWLGRIENADETRGLFEMTSWKTKGKYVSKPLNCVDLCYDKAGHSGNKGVPSETSSE